MTFKLGPIMANVNYEDEDKPLVRYRRCPRCRVQIPITYNNGKDIPLSRQIDLMAQHFKLAHKNLVAAGPMIKVEGE